MMDQKKKLSLRGISVEFVGEGQIDEVAVSLVIKGDIQLVFISPESLLTNKTYRRMLRSDAYQKKLVAFAVDEAHCVKLWYVNAMVYYLVIIL